MAYMQFLFEFDKEDGWIEKSEVLDSECNFDTACVTLLVTRAVTDHLLFKAQTMDVQISMDLDKTKAIYLRNILNAFIETHKE